MNEELQDLPKPKKKWKIFLIIGLFLIGAFIIYIHIIEPKLFITHEEAIVDSELPLEFNGFKIVQFSDIHYGSTINNQELKKIVNMINELKPDVIVYTGDLLDDSINMKEENYEQIATILSDLKATLKKYAVIGNSDYINKDKYIEIMEKAQFKVLQNENDLLYYKGNMPIQFIGTSSSLEQEMDIEKATQIDNNDLTFFKVWLHHEPIIFDTLLETELRPNVILTGHTLSGLVKIPFYGSLLTQDGVDKYTDNYYHRKKMSMYISNGLGTYKYPIRFLNFPSITLYRLYNQ